jgi:hypothetical protein
MSAGPEEPSPDGPDDPEPGPEAPRLELELDLSGPAGPASGRDAAARPGPIGPPQAWPADDEDSLGGIGAGGIALELSEPATAPASRRGVSRAGPRSHRDAGRSIQVRRHSLARRPTHTGQILLALLWVAIVIVAVPFIHPDGATLLGRWLGKLGWLPYVAVGLLIFIAWAVVTARGVALGSLGLGLTSIGSVALLACLGLVAASILGGSATALTLREVMPVAAPLCAAAVPLGLGAFALRRAIEELRQPDRRIPYAALLGLLGLGSLAIGLRTARVDLPLPRLGQSHALVWWAPVPID